MKTVALLFLSNIFMTTAWYGHLRHRSTSIFLVILISWLIALPEYALQVPANRWGYGTFNAPQLKIIQEVISITVFSAFCWIYLKEPLRWNHGIAFLFLVGAVFFALLKPK